MQSNADPTLRQYYSPTGNQLPIDTWKVAVDNFVAARIGRNDVRFFVTAEEKHVYVYDADLAATAVDGVTVADFFAGVAGDESFVSALSP